MGLQEELAPGCCQKLMEKGLRELTESSTKTNVSLQQKCSLQAQSCVLLAREGEQGVNVDEQAPLTTGITQGSALLGWSLLKGEIA